MSPRAAWCAAAAVAIALRPGPARAEPERLARESSGLFELTDETTLALAGFRGQTILREGSAGGIQFSSVTADGKRSPLETDVWVDGTVVTLRPPEDTGDQPRVLDVSVPPMLTVKIETADNEIAGSGLAATILVKGPHLATNLRGITGDVVVDTDFAKIRLESIEGGATIRASDSDVDARGIVGPLSVSAARGSLTVSSVGGLNANLEGVASNVEIVNGPLEVGARAGRLSLSLARHGGSLDLAGTTLRLEHSEGTFTVETDAAVEALDCKCDLRLKGESGALHSVRNAGSVDAVAHGARVVLEDGRGSVRVGGDGLAIEVTRLQGDLAINVSSSTIAVVDARGPIDIEGDGGNISVQNPRDVVKLKSHNADVKVEDASGLVQVDADTVIVDVAWLSMGFDGTSSLKNDRGSVVARFPASGSAHIEAESQYGQVECEFATITVDSDRRKATGVIGHPGPAVVHVVSGGDARLLGPEQPAASSAPDEDR